MGDKTLYDSTVTVPGCKGVTAAGATIVVVVEARAVLAKLVTKDRHKSADDSNTRRYRLVLDCVPHGGVCLLCVETIDGTDKSSETAFSAIEFVKVQAVGHTLGFRV